MDYEKISKIFYEQLKDELERRPMTAAKLNNPMNQDKKEALFSAIFCYDEKTNRADLTFSRELRKMNCIKRDSTCPLSIPHGQE